MGFSLKTVESNCLALNNLDNSILEISTRNTFSFLKRV